MDQPIKNADIDIGYLEASQLCATCGLDARYRTARFIGWSCPNGHKSSLPPSDDKDFVRAREIWRQKRQRESARLKKLIVVAFLIIILVSASLCAINNSMPPEPDQKSEASCISDGFGNTYCRGKHEMYGDGPGQISEFD